MTTEYVIGMYDGTVGQSDTFIVETTAELGFASGAFATPAALLAKVRKNKKNKDYKRAVGLAYAAWAKHSIGVPTESAVAYGKAFGEKVLGYLAKSNPVAALEAAFDQYSAEVDAKKEAKALAKAAPSEALPKVVQSLRETANAVDRGAVLTAEDLEAVAEILDLVDQIRSLEVLAA